MPHQKLCEFASRNRTPLTVAHEHQHSDGANATADDDDEEEEEQEDEDDELDETVEGEVGKGPGLAAYSVPMHRRWKVAERKQGRGSPCSSELSNIRVVPVL